MIKNITERPGWIELNRVVPELAKYLEICNRDISLAEIVAELSKSNMNIHRVNNKLSGMFFKLNTQLFDSTVGAIGYIKEFKLFKDIKFIGFGDPFMGLIANVIYLDSTSCSYSDLSPNDIIKIDKILTADKFTLHTRLKQYDDRFKKIIGENYINSLLLRQL